MTRKQGLAMTVQNMAVLPGLLLCGVIALAATFVSEHYGGPQLLYALLIGLAFHYLSRDEKILVGLDFCSKAVLRAGVALLGLRITLTQVSALGWRTALLVALGVASTIALGLLLALVQAACSRRAAVRLRCWHLRRFGRAGGVLGPAVNPRE